jgi:hypothetical protein
MKTLKFYLAYVRHDHGTHIFKVSAYSKNGVINQLMSAEGCPRRAIYKIWPMSTHTGRSSVSGKAGIKSRY